MTTGHEYHLIKRCQELVEELGLKLEIKKEQLTLIDKTGLCLGTFEGFETLIEYLCGYDAGFEQGWVKGYNKAISDAKRSVKKAEKIVKKKLR